MYNTLALYIQFENFVTESATHLYIYYDTRIIKIEFVVVVDMDVWWYTRNFALFKSWSCFS